RYFSEHEIAAFRRDGFLKVTGLLDARAAARLAAWSDELVARPEEPGRHMVYYEDDLA
ncbi:MAG: phytanoyl-CoA dioxygenase family protein, partial [Gammaproteobacteria bacterium]|nr:phytanoyl-CoA dioxygenase family protein [Gammaproteobacteria bacterium]